MIWKTVAIKLTKPAHDASDASGTRQLVFGQQKLPYSQMQWPCPTAATTTSLAPPKAATNDRYQSVPAVPAALATVFVLWTRSCWFTELELLIQKSRHKNDGKLCEYHHRKPVLRNKTSTSSSTQKASDLTNKSSFTETSVPHGTGTSFAHVDDRRDPGKK